MLKLRPIGKVNKGPSAPWWPNFENVKKQKMDLITILIIPENMNPQSPSLETQWSFVKFVKILKNWLVWRFFAIILALGQKNPKFLHFLNPYTCPDLGQEESQKVWSTLVITLVETFVPTVLRAAFIGMGIL